MDPGTLHRTFEDADHDVTMGGGVEEEAPGWGGEAEEAAQGGDTEEATGPGNHGLGQWRNRLIESSWTFSAILYYVHFQPG